MERDLTCLGPFHDYVDTDISDNTRERFGITWLNEYKTNWKCIKTPRWFLQLGEYLQEPNREGEIFLVIGIGGKLLI